MRGSRNGFSLIELIFAIIVIGIAFSAVPSILETSNRSVEGTMQSRGFFHGLSLMQIIRNKYWDENNANDFAGAGLYYVLQTGEAGLGCAANNGKSRAGHYGGINRRQCDRLDAPSPLGDFGPAADTGNYNDIDDFNADPQPLLENSFQPQITVNYTDYVGNLNGTGDTLILSGNPAGGPRSI